MGLSCGNDAVDALLARRHGDDPRWQRAEEQTARISRLIGGGHVRPLLVHARAAGHRGGRRSRGRVSSQ